MGLETFLFHGNDTSGVRLLVFGAIHGNERCGPKAAKRVMDKIRDGAITILKGSVRFVPICNEEAYQRHARLFEENLNRVFRKTEHPATYEARRANELCELMENEADALLDLHSSSAPGPVSVFIDYPTPENRAFALALKAEYGLLGWPNVYEKNAYGFESYDTTRYAYEIGTPGILVECGQHSDPQTITVAETMIMRALAHYGMVDVAPETPRPATRLIRMKTLEKKNAEEDAFDRTWEHLESMSAGTRIATRQSGEALIAEHDGVIILPKHAAKAGEEWFYLGTVE